MSWDSHIFTTQASLEKKCSNLYSDLVGYNFDDKIELAKTYLSYEVKQRTDNLDSITNLEILNDVSDFLVLSMVFMDNAQGSDSDNYDNHIYYESKYKDFLNKRIGLLEFSTDEDNNSFVISQGRILR